MRRLYMLITLFGVISMIHAQESSDYGLVGGVFFDHQNTILPLPENPELGFGGFYRYNMNPRYSIRANVNYITNDFNIEQGMLDIRGMFEFNFVSLDPRMDKPKASTFIATGLGWQSRITGLPGSVKEIVNMLGIPFHVGVKYNLGEQWALTTEWGLRKGFLPDPVDGVTGFRSAVLSNWQSFVGITIGYKVIKRCRTCPFYENNR